MKNKTTKTIACVIAGLSLSVITGCMKNNNVTYEVIEGRDNLNFEGAISPSQGYAVNCDSYPCRTGISRAISIKPITDTTGTAIYSGTLNWRVFNNSELHDIDIHVNFASTQWWLTETVYTDVGDYSVRMNGRFDSRGAIFGDARIGNTANAGQGSTPTFITGIIGATEMIGVFNLEAAAGGFFVRR